MRVPAMWAASHFLRPLPLPREVHLWCLFPEDIQDPALWKFYEGLLSPDEKKHVAEGRNVKVQNERLLARTLVRTTLCRYTGGAVDPASLEFAKNQFGKPKVMWPTHTVRGETWRPPQLCFNLSHTNSLLTCAVTLNTRVGIDVEEKERRMSRDLMTLARRRLSPEEADWLSQFTDPIEQRYQFMQLWTLKEAYVKALGKGISRAPLKDFTFGLRPSPLVHGNLEKSILIPAHAQACAITLKFSETSGTLDEPLLPASAWQFLLFQPSPSHFASVCSQRHPTGSSEVGQIEESVDEDFRVEIWRTVPLICDGPLKEGAQSLGLSPPTRLSSCLEKLSL